MKTPRIRFNWGYHDGAMAFDMRYPYQYKHFDLWYLKGWQAGYEDRHEGCYRQCSDLAWGKR